jgi:hypothetical protein
MRPWLLAAFAVVTVASTIVFATGHDPKGDPIRHPKADGEYYYTYLPSLWLDGDLDFTDEYKVTGNWYRFGKAPTGRPSNVFGIGPAVFESPFFLVGHGLARVTGARADGFSGVEKTLVAWASVIASIAAAFFAWRLAARRLGCDGGALAGVLLTFVGGSVFYYACRQPGYAHPFATLFAAWLIDAWDRSYEQPRTIRTWVTLGALFGAAVLARPQLATWAIVLAASAADDLWRAREDRRELGRIGGRLAAGAAVSCLVVLPQLLAWKSIYGTLYLVPQGEHFMRWDDPAWSEVLFSSRNGLLPWAPLYAVGLIGLFAAARRLPRLCAVLLGGIALQAIANGAVWDWWAGGSFGGRRFDSTYVAFAFGVAIVVVGAWRLVRASRVPLRVLGGAGLALCGTLAISTLILAMTYTGRTVRIQGGRAAAEIYRERLPPPLSWLSAQASYAANLPARAWYALEHDVSLDAYDRNVGVHWLGETYPGLNSRPPALKDDREVAKINAASRSGFAKIAKSTAMTMTTGHARVLIGLNVRGDVRVVVTASNPAGGELAIAWDGGTAVTSPLTEAATPAPALAIDEPSRGTHELSLRAPPGTVVHRVRVEADSLVDQGPGSAHVSP